MVVGEIAVELLMNDPLDDLHDRDLSDNRLEIRGIRGIFGLDRLNDMGTIGMFGISFVFVNVILDFHAAKAIIPA